MITPQVRESYVHESAPLLSGTGEAVFARPPWCGNCDERTRMLVTPDGPQPCPACHAYCYRYRLSRTWGSSGTHATWIMLNPSTADAMTDDATIRRCVAFTKAWGLDGLIVVNLFALRATDPRQLARHRDPVGPANNQFIREAIHPWSVVVAAWGAHRMADQRTAEVMEIIAKQAGRASCLGVTQAGYPKHPVRLLGATELREFAGVAAT